MTAVLQSPSHLPSSPSSQLSCSSSDALQTLLTSEGHDGSEEVEEEREESLFYLLVTALRRSMAQCRVEEEEEEEEEGDRRSMEIGWPTEVRHVAHVTFDRFHGFLGLPVEFEPEVPRRAPSASATVFGVSTESMQCSYDPRGNSIPTILLLMQRRLYERGGLQAEGIFRINGENGQEEFVRDQLNSGIVPDGIDVHCLAGLIKAWLRELPTGVLDPLTPEQVKQCQSEEECAQVVSLLPPTEAALLDWAINLMADVVQEEQKNKMNARNVAMVFAPNMTQMADPLTALMYVVQVMNFLKMLILRTLKSRQELTVDDYSVFHSDPSDENGHNSPQVPLEADSNIAVEQVFVPEEPNLDDLTQDSKENLEVQNKITDTSENSHGNVLPEETTYCTDENFCELPRQTDGQTEREEINVNSSAAVQANVQRTGKAKSNSKKGRRKAREPSPIQANMQAEKSKGTSIVTRINSKTERIEAWR
ncbi:uncharacterized protein A4U43_C09F660 [Asparagus officinalis]|uniref:Rho-GAP domain-containing protein n=1 Tax=Asparagus officinalis TaxID=4686 RepID=A0A5P1E464_ASPOF|nr:rho GTPase-activating protein 4-like [Asparagus officinalis]ONK57452.1 uncharacterized protein A4U43_C09F660 [Asparagus officinalis]